MRFTENAPGFVAWRKRSNFRVAGAATRASPGVNADSCPWLGSSWLRHLRRSYFEVKGIYEFRRSRGHEARIAFKARRLMKRLAWKGVRKAQVRMIWRAAALSDAVQAKRAGWQAAWFAPAPRPGIASGGPLLSPAPHHLFGSGGGKEGWISVDSRDRCFHSFVHPRRMAV